MINVRYIFIPISILDFFVRVCFIPSHKITVHVTVLLYVLTAANVIKQTHQLSRLKKCLTLITHGLNIPGVEKSEQNINFE